MCTHVFRGVFHVRCWCVLMCLGECFMEGMYSRVKGSVSCKVLVCTHVFRGVFHVRCWCVLTCLGECFM